MTEFNSNEPLWVGMDVDAELARYAEEDLCHGEAEAVGAPRPSRPSRRSGLRAALPMLGKGGIPRLRPAA
jgi:hypothetical protein